MTAILSLLVGLRAIPRPHLKRSLGLLLILLVWADVLTHAPRQNPTVSPAVYEAGLNRFSSPVIAGAGRAMISPDAKAFLYTEATDSISTNYVRNRLALNGNLNLLDNVAKVDGFFSLDLREYDRVARLLYARRSSEFPALMDFLGVSQLTERGKYFTWSTRTNFLPLATAGQKPVFADPPEILSALTNATFDPRRIVYLTPEARPFVRATNASAAHVSLPHFSAHRLEFHVEAPAPAIVVVAQTFYHPWRAYVDDRAVPLWRANYAFQAFEVPDGQCSVRLVYEDRAWQFGVIISVSSVIGWIASSLPFRRVQVTSA